MIRSLVLLLWSASGLLAAQEGAPPPTPSSNELVPRELAFQKLLAHAVLEGRFTVHGRPDQAEVQKERYTIGNVTKIEGEKWRVESRMEFMGRDVTFPVPVRVRFIDDETPVIVVDDFGLPGIGKYGARVVFAHGEYAGIWWGKDYGGQLFGKVLSGAAQPGAVGVLGDHKSVPARGADWPQFRGPQARGMMEGHALPASFDLATKENLRWRIEVPGMSHASPVIVGEKLFLVTSIPAEGEAKLKVGLYGSIEPVEDDGPQKLTLLCYDKKSGEKLWERVAFEGEPEIKRHPKGSHAQSTPAADGERVLAFFGSEGLYCYSHAGELLWKKDLGRLDGGYFMVKDAQWGYGSSPVLHEGVVYVICDVQENSFLAALDAKTGEEIWRTARADVPGWCTPTIDVREGRSQVIVNGWKHIGGYDLATGAPLWWMAGKADIPVPTPVVAHDTIFLTNAHGGPPPIFAIDPLHEGQIEFTSEPPKGMRWWKPTGGSYMPTPIVVGDQLFLSGDAGVLSCYDAKTGELRFKERLDTGGFTASPVAGDGKLYIPSEVGDIHIVKAAPTFERLSVSTLGEECMASPAISEGVLYFRSRRHLTAISSTPPR
ncbi:MAG: PQQ-binding-like beta-propeller repeat protein [Planctomycetes bacterium]|nr:PQQ-binding-like beta-propeller repeat protein [Planctomycetota bacterium]